MLRPINEYPPASANMKIIHITDTHGVDISFAQLYTAIEQEIKQDKKQNQAIRHLLIITGDIFGSNTILSNYSKGQFDIDMIKQLCKLFPVSHRLFVAGNHDFNFGIDTFTRLIETCNLQFLACNVEFIDEFKTQPITSVKIGDITFQGLMTPETSNNHSAKKIIKHLQPTPELSPSPDFILSHLGLGDDQNLPYDAHILGGHSHHEYLGVNPQHPNKRLINAGCKAELYSSIMMENTSVTHAELKYTARFQPAPAMIKIIEQHKAMIVEQIGCQLDEDIFHIDATSIMPGGLDYVGDINEVQGHLRITDCFITRATADAVSKHFGDDKIALMPAAIFRSNFKPNQTVTTQDLMEMYYMNIQLVELRMTGAELVRGLSKGILSNYKYWHGRGKFLHPSQQLAYSYTIDAEPGETLQALSYDEEPINLDATYCIITTDWIVDAQVFNKAIEIKRHKPNELPFLVAEFLKNQSVQESFQQRINNQQSVQRQERIAQQNNRASNIDPNTVNINLEHFRKQPDQPHKARSLSRSM